MKTVFRPLVFLALLCALFPTAFAQSDRGGISGKIADKSGALLPGAVVTLTNEATGVVQKVTSNASGDYVFQLLNPGSYKMSVSAQGFNTTQLTHIIVDVGQVNEQNFELKIGSTSETVEVTTGVQQLQTETGSLGMIVEQKSIQDLPLVYGNPFTLETLAPGIAVSGVNPNIHAYDSSTATVSVNGSSLNSIEYRLDGAPDNRIRLSAYTPSTEMINQYKVETASYDATEGHSSGGFVNVSLKGGANQFHGSAFSFLPEPHPQLELLASRQQTVAKASWLRVGGDVGGPIWRNKVFFFGGYEHSRAATPNVQSLTVPSAAEPAVTSPNSMPWTQPTRLASPTLINCTIPPAVTPSRAVSAAVERAALFAIQSPATSSPTSTQSSRCAEVLPGAECHPERQGGGNYQYSESEPDY